MRAFSTTPLFTILGPMLLIAACGGSGGGDSTNSNPDAPIFTSNSAAAFVSVTSPDASSRSTACDSIQLSGPAFISPTWFRCCSGSASDAAVTVSWSNATNSKSGVATDFVNESFLGLTGHSWTATVPLVLGRNVVTISAADPAGLVATETLPISKTANSYTVSGHLLSASGTAIGTDVSGIDLHLSGDKTGTASASSNALVPISTYTFSCVVNGNYAITPAGGGLTFGINPPMQTVTVSGSDVSNVDFQTNAYLISGAITGASGVIALGTKVTITDGAASYSVFSGGNGTLASNAAFTFAAPNGSFAVTPVPTPPVPLLGQPGTSFTPVSHSVVVNNTDVTGVDFTEQ